MRQLSKVIFINSAGIRYGEVRLDGNVHLIGTQGVGKSTVLLMKTTLLNCLIFVLLRNC